MPHGKKHFQKSWLKKLIRMDIVLENVWRKIKHLHTVTCTTSFKFESSSWPQSNCGSCWWKLKGIRQISDFSTTKDIISMSESPRSKFCVPKQESHWSSDSRRGCMVHERLACNYSYNSCEDLPDFSWRFLALTQGTFLLAVITEISYVISDGLVPYVQELLCHTEEKWQLIYTTVWWNGHCTKPYTVGLAATMDEVTNSFLVEVWMRTI